MSERRIIKSNFIPLIKANIGLPIFFLWLISLFFSYRHVFFTTTNYISGVYSDFTSISLYISDILLFLLLLCLYFSREKKICLSKPLFWWFCWILVSTLTLIPHLTTLNYWFLLKTFEGIVAYGTLFVLFTKYSNIKLLFIKFFAFLATIEGIIAFAQFIKQSSLGFLKYGGEPVFNANLPNVAKIVVDNVKFVRAYGTFPHPNLLSAFLLTGSLFLIFLLRNTKSPYKRILLSTALFINIGGLGLTFSRASLLAFSLGVLLYLGITITREKLKERKEIVTMGTIIASCIMATTILWPFLATRATVSDSASLERITYTKIGMKMIADHPISGMGIGESMLHMQQYTPLQLEPWQIQPIHNYFLLIAAEVGIPGMLLMVYVLIWHLYHLFIQHRRDATGKSALLFSVLVCFFLLMQFDHYFYTLQQTQLLLWSVLALAAAQIKSEHEKNSSTM